MHICLSLRQVSENVIIRSLWAPVTLNLSGKQLPKPRHFIWGSPWPSLVRPFNVALDTRNKHGYVLPCCALHVLVFQCQCSVMLLSFYSKQGRNVRNYALVKRRLIPSYSLSIISRDAQYFNRSWRNALLSKYIKLNTFSANLHCVFYKTSWVAVN